MQPSELILCVWARMSVCGSTHDRCRAFIDHDIEIIGVSDLVIYDSLENRSRHKTRELFHSKEFA